MKEKKGRERDAVKGREKDGMKGREEKRRTREE